MDTVASVPEDGEKIIEIQLERLRTFKNHPFKIRMDQEMIRLSASVEKYRLQKQRKQEKNSQIRNRKQRSTIWNSNKK
ncbi:hypothetical protein [Blautia glucerasea]|uniref:hypothetical protein n=1 Tax=Blautia glucerasea TaxID=536633 RepID=UPI001D09050B|nr:hypothetical protein [Blautia glucerasea]MCB6547009.1 hypothetical protein [Blautia glucerasea]